MICERNLIIENLEMLRRCKFDKKNDILLDIGEGFWGN